MDYVSGRPLDEIIAKGEQQPIGETLRLFGLICDAIGAAHLRGVIHRDLKPSNVRIKRNGEPIVVDFGLAKIAVPDVTDETSPRLMTATGQFIGSLPWASPEQAEGSPDKIDIRTDVYSLGVMLFQMLTGRFPYQVIGNMRDVLDNIMRAEPARPSTVRRQINDEVETIVLKCLSKDRERRYQSAIELVEPLDPQFADANPTVMRTVEASQWLNAHHHRSPITRYGLMVFETVDAIDPAYESIAITLLDGTLDSAGYPDYSGIVGAIVAYWDEVTGDQMVRALVGWGGKGVRGDTERTATKTLGSMLAAVVASVGAAELVELERPLPPDSGMGLVCPQCHFAQVGQSAFFCLKCGTRMLRG